ncbi:MAG TPA: GxxExxY protein [Pyrinomonadaceae bacterium]|jgi:hypothetical protein
MDDIVYKDESYKITGAGLEVYKQNGGGFLEAVYQERPAIEVETKARPSLLEINKAQTLNYLNATKFDSALPVSFGHFPKLEHKRIADNLKKQVT